jgi:3-oxoadipate enol-lactonase
VRTRSRPGLFLSDRGAGEPVLLITGWTISSAVFDPIANLYERHLRIIAYDHRGAGRSDPWLGPVSMAMLAADAARVLADRGLRSAHIVGLSMGAAVALELALRMPHRVRSLILVGGGAGGPSTALPGAREASAAMRSVVADSLRHRRPWPAAVLFSESFRDRHPGDVAAYLPFFAMHRAPPWTTGWQALAVACFGRRAALGGLRAPTLILHGGRDVLVPVANAHLLADGIPDAELHVVHDAGHAVPLEHPEATAQLLTAWVRDHADRRPPEPRRVELVRELVSRPLSLPAGGLSNTGEAVRHIPRSALSTMLRAARR